MGFKSLIWWDVYEKIEQEKKAKEEAELKEKLKEEPRKEESVQEGADQGSSAKFKREDGEDNQETSEGKWRYRDDF